MIFKSYLVKLAIPSTNLSHGGRESRKPSWIFTGKIWSVHQAFLYWIYKTISLIAGQAFKDAARTFDRKNWINSRGRRWNGNLFGSIEANIAITAVEGPYATFKWIHPILYVPSFNISRYSMAFDPTFGYFITCVFIIQWSFSRAHFRGPAVFMPYRRNAL